MSWDAGNPATEGATARLDPPVRRALVRPSVRLVLPHEPHDPHSERVRALRTELVLRHDSRDGANIIALLSPQPGEGRSQLAAELAVSFAHLGRPTLLVDADLRHSAQHVLFMADNSAGLSQAIAGAPPRLHPVEGSIDLSLLTAGPAVPNPLELLSNRRFSQLLEEWREKYEYIVIDTPPVTRYADGIAVAALARRVVALARANHTPYGETRSMLRRLVATGSSVVGAVINRF